MCGINYSLSLDIKIIGFQRHTAVIFMMGSYACILNNNAAVCFKRFLCGGFAACRIDLLARGVGIEVTEAVAADLAWADAIQERDKIDTIRLFQRVQPGDPRLSRSNVEKIARGEAVSEGWAGDSVEQDWADVMAHFTSRKAERFAQPGFAHLDFNWLLVYDNWELPAVNQFKAASIFQTWLISVERHVPFDQVFVECHENIW